MERQKSFSFKPTRFLVFSCTVSLSIFFLAFFSIWVIRVIFLVNQETHFHLGLKPLITQTFTGFNSNFSADELRNGFLTRTRLGRPVNESEVAKVSRLKGFPRKESESENPDWKSQKSDDDDAVNGNFLGSSANNSVSTPENSFELDNESDFVARNGNFSGFRVNNSGLITSEMGKDSVFESGIGNLKGSSANNSVSTPENSFELDNESDFESRNGNFSGFRVNNNSGLSTSEIGKDSVFESRIGNLKSVKSDASSSGNMARVSSTSGGKKGERNCDITNGKWVFDESYPLYTSASCPFIDEAFNCEANGRLNNDYLKWRWQPQHCDIPRFNATKMLELIRGKRLVFVGDSINRNQWESMLCMLMGGIKDPKRVYETRGRRITKGKGNYSFKFVDYKCTVEYYVTHFLVHESKARIGKKRVQTLQIDTIDRGTSKGKGADILVFNSAHWWTHEKTKSGTNYYQEGNQVHPQLDATTAFRKAMVTWSLWVDKFVGSRKTKVFFRSSAPAHFRGGQWNAGGHCREASQPLNETLSMDYPKKNMVIEEVIRQMKTPVTLLNITGLSDYRIDGHPSIYGRRPGQSYPSGGEDCSHWCLPGVPDTWNELLHFQLLSKLGER